MEEEAPGVGDGDDKATKARDDARLGGEALRDGEAYRHASATA